jgi:hypothetical protein
MNEEAWQILEDRFAERRHEAFALHKNGTRDATQTFAELVRIEAEYIQALYTLYEKEGTERLRGAAGASA